MIENMKVFTFVIFRLPVCLKYHAVIPMSDNSKDLVKFAKMYSPKWIDRKVREREVELFLA